MAPKAAPQAHKLSCGRGVRVLADAYGEDRLLAEKENLFAICFKFFHCKKMFPAPCMAKDWVEILVAEVM